MYTLNIKLKCLQNITKVIILTHLILNLSYKINYIHLFYLRILYLLTHLYTYYILVYLIL